MGNVVELEAAYRVPLRIFQLEDGWRFEVPFVETPSGHDNTPRDGVVYHPDKPKKGRTDALGLGGVVICDAWKKSRRIITLKR